MQLANIDWKAGTVTIKHMKSLRVDDIGVVASLLLDRTDHKKSRRTSVNPHGRPVA